MHRAKAQGERRGKQMKVIGLILLAIFIATLVVWAER